MNIKNTVDLDTKIEDLVVDHLLVNNVNDRRSAELVLKHSRGDFLEDEYSSLASCDGAIYYQQGRFIIEIATIGLMISLIKKQRLESALVIGAGLGYGSALLSDISDNVVALEEDEILTSKAKDNLDSKGIKNVKVIKGNINGFRTEAKFDLVLVEGAFSKVEISWLDLLKDDGMLIGVRRIRNISKVIGVKKNGKDIVISEYQQVPTPYLLGFEDKEAFIF